MAESYNTPAEKKEAKKAWANDWSYRGTKDL